MKTIKNIILIVCLCILNLNIIFAENAIKETTKTNSNSLTLEDIWITENIQLNEKLNIDLSSIENKLQKYHNSTILFEWNIPWENTKNWAIFEKQFENFWEKEINLSIYKISWDNKELITNSKIKIFVYKTEISIIFQNELWDKINNFISKSKESWIFINQATLENIEIEKYDFKENIEKNLNDDNYLIIWWNKEFIFDILSKINSENLKNGINIVWISSFNINILQKYLHNFTSNKSWINKAILLDESSKYEILKQTENITNLENEIIKNNYEYINLDSISKINDILFISKFINNLSGLWFSTTNIYLILIIPFLLLAVSIFKHLIGLTPTWILIPVVITLLFIKLTILPTIILIIIFFITNILLSKAITKYSLHYTPKITMLTIINIIVFIITINLFLNYNLINIEINDIMFIIFFILIAEKLINVIVSKEFWEYKHTLINTILFSTMGYLIFSFSFIKTFILAYPEIILLLIPLSFIIWRFTGLRVTEYFRFKEVIKSIEEE